MNYQGHQIKQEDWSKLQLCEQLANVGAEVGRAINWRHKGQPQPSQSAFYRSLELLSLSIDCATSTQRTELCRLYEVWVDFFYGDNQYKSTENSMNRYFMHFNLLVSKKRLS